MAEAQTLVFGEKKLTDTNKPQKITEESQILTGLTVKAKSTNAATIRVGPSTVEGKGYPLAKSESLQFDVIDATRVYVYGTEKDGVNWLGLKP